MTDEQLVSTVRILRMLMEGSRGEAQDANLWEIGASYFIRTVTHHFTGRLVAVTHQELWLEDAAWIPDDGRFAQVIVSCNFNEVEPYPAGKKVAIGRGSLIDAHQIATLPRTQK